MTLQENRPIYTSEAKVATNSNITKARLNYMWEDFLKLHFSKCEGCKRIIKHTKYCGFQSQPCLILRDIPCTYFICQNPIFLIKASDGVMVITITIKNQKYGYGSKALVKFTQLVMCPRVILNDHLVFSRICRGLPRNIPFPHKTDVIKIIFSGQNDPTVVFKYPPHRYIEFLISIKTS